MSDQDVKPPRRWLCGKCNKTFLYFAERVPNYCPLCNGGPLSRSDEFKGLTAIGAGRDAENEKSLCIYFDRRPTDDELRAVHNFLRRSPAKCPFCKTPTYSLPCSQCGEPDIPDGF